MELNIKDLLDDYIEDEIELRSKRAPKPRKIERMVIDRIARTEFSELRHPRARSMRKFLRTVPIAAVIACFLTVTAYAAVGSYLMERSYRIDSKLGSAVNMMGYVGSDEYRAILEWSEYESESYKNGTNLLEAGAEMPDELAPYWQNGAFTEEARNKMDEIMAAYGLTPVECLSYFSSPEELYQLTGRENYLPPMGDPGQDPWTGPDPDNPDIPHQRLPISGRFYSRGCLEYGGSALLENGQSVRFDMTNLTRGSFMRGSAVVTRNENFEEWSYVTKSGVSVILDLGATRAFIMAELENSFVSIFVRSGSSEPDTSTDQGRIAAYSGFAILDKEMLEELADLFDFAVINELSRN